MSADPSGEVTSLLQNWSKGHKDALDKLMPVVYAELRRLARSFPRTERPDHTLQSCALVNEAYIRLIDQRNVDWKNRAQFLGVAAQAMRRILVDHARKKHAVKRKRRWKKNCFRRSKGDSKPATSRSGWSG